MALLKFDQSGKRFYETGVDHGVLYVKGGTGAGANGYQKGVAWNGLTAVTESPSGAEATALYADNIKYLNLISAEEFGATIECYTYPDEFALCNGEAQLSTTVAGVSIGQQPRSQFAFVYRTKVGNDENSELGFKYHIIYSCNAAPSERAYATVNDSPEAITFSYEITTTPVDVTGFKATAHLEIDTTKFTEATKSKLDAIINSLYGTDPDPEDPEDEGTDPTLLLPDEIIAILKATT